MLTRLKDLVVEGTEEYCLAQQIDPDKVPVHLAVIMDGNGRWAKTHGLKRVDGHKVGAESAEKITQYSLLSGIKYLTLFAFSSENWKRPVTEVNTLMNMLYQKLVEQKEMLIENNIRLKIIGEPGRLPGKLKKKLAETSEFSRDYNAMQLNLALNYGSRMEIVNAARKIVEDKIPAKKIDETLFKKYLYTADCPDPDLLVRTSGEQRISNFLLYQIAYSELVFTPVMWPDFRLKQFLEAILAYQHRERRFGKV